MQKQKVNELLSRRKKCAIYIRVSSERQVQGFSLDGQKRELIDYAKAKHLEVADIYVEEGKSGKSIEGRDAFQKMMSDVTRQDSEVGYVLVFKLSRFGRNIRDILNSINILNKYGIHLLTKEEGLDSSNNMGNLMITIIGTLAEVERENIITQTMLGREEKSRQGGWCGGFAPIGYSIQDERLVKNEYAYLVEQIFDKYVNENVGIKGIVDYLNKNGIEKPIPKNKLDYQFTDWSTHTIKSILDNPVYTGYIVFGRRRTVECVNQKTGEIEYKLRKQDQENYVWSDEQAHEPIISKELFDKAQLKRKNRACKGNRQIGQATKHLLSGLLKCPECGSGMVINYNKWKNKDGTVKRTMTYICGHYNRSGTYGQCSRNGIASDLIEKEVVEYTKRLIHNEKFVDYVKAKIGQSIDITEIEKELAEYDKKLKALERNKNILEKEIDNLLDDDKVANRKRADMNKRLDKIYLDMDLVESERTECQERLNVVRNQQLNEQNIYKILLEFDRIYDTLSMEDKGKLLHSLISEIQLYNKDEIMESKTYIKKIKFAFDVQNAGYNLGDKGNSVEVVIKMQYCGKEKN